MKSSESGCPMDSLLRVIAGQWTTHILWVIGNNRPIGFNELKRQVGGISAKVLTVRLRALEAEEIISRAVKPTNPPQVSYDLTSKGQDLVQVFDQLNKIAKRWAKKK